MNGTYNSYGNWELHKKLGAGGFGEVILWKNRSNQMEIATKSLNENKQLCRDEEQKLSERWTQELEFMRNLNADCIVKAIQLADQEFVAYLNERHAWKPLPVLVMEYCNGGDLRNHLQKNENLNGLCEYEIREILRSLRNAVDYMHNKCNIKHRDLKPDNIVIHKMDNGKKVYKLTDFGFARNINERTMLQSVVGTRNYFAPEIVDSSGYTKTVDYWSVGVMAFEMLCGVLPFIPHQTMFHKLQETKRKPNNCIAITEDFKKANQFHVHDRIFDENRVSDFFRHEIEKWLRLALDVNYRTRGTTPAAPAELPNMAGGRVLRFYSDLDALLNTRVLTIFCLTNYRYYHYKVDESTTHTDLLSKIMLDSGIPLERIFVILPVGHPLKAVANMKRVFDFFVEEWCDTSVDTNPPAMFFITDIENSSKFPEPQISAVISHCFIAHNPDADTAPNWLKQKFALDINFTLTNEQRHSKTFLYGLQEYAVNVEHIIFEFGQQVKQTNSQANHIHGMITQFVNNFNVVRKLQQSSKSSTQSTLLADWQQKIENLRKNIEEIAKNVVPKLQTRYNSALRRAKELANCKLFNEKSQEDIFAVALFQRHMLASHQNYKIDELNVQASACSKCRSFFSEALAARANFLENKTITSARVQISALNKEFKKIRDATIETATVLSQMNTKIHEFTQSFNTELFGNLRNDSVNKMPWPQIVPPANMDAATTSLTVNGLCDSFSHLMDISTKDLIEETQESIRLMAMDLDAPLDDIPTTIHSN